ncbi:hypothetical protein K438DRAFT_1768133 [Mycena galopus ATCC 62051]|nr:hypothetical protein K438DRAFT_1768133 [Mycena galopus ATCC 62051]
MPKFHTPKSVLRLNDRGRERGIQDLPKAWQTKDGGSQIENGAKSHVPDAKSGAQARERGVGAEIPDGDLRPRRKLDVPALRKSAGCAKTADAPRLERNRTSRLCPRATPSAIERAQAHDVGSLRCLPHKPPPPEQSDLCQEPGAKNGRMFLGAQGCVELRDTRDRVALGEITARLARVGQGKGRGPATANPCRSPPKPHRGTAKKEEARQAGERAFESAQKPRMREGQAAHRRQDDGHASAPRSRKDRKDDGELPHAFSPGSMEHRELTRHSQRDRVPFAQYTRIARSNARARVVDSGGRCVVLNEARALP